MTGRVLRPEDYCHVCLPNLSGHPLKPDEMLLAFDVWTFEGEVVQARFREVFKEVTETCRSFRFCLHIPSVRLRDEQYMRVTIRCYDDELIYAVRRLRCFVEDALIGPTLGCLADFFSRDDSYPVKRIHDMTGERF